MTAGHLALMAKELGMEPRFLVQQARDVAALVPGAIGQAARDIAPALAPSARTLADRLVRFVSVNCRKLTARLADD